MRKSSLSALLALALLCFGVTPVCAADSELPDPDANAVYNYITRIKPYQNWPLYPGKGRLYQGRHPHGAFLTTYVSPEAEASIKAKQGMLPNGAFVIKENYTPEKKLAAITVMYRVKDYNPDAGNWFWAKYRADGSVEKSGKVGGCISCHSAVLPNDWLFTGPVK